MSEFTTPTQIARETLHRLAIRRITPTPENFRSLYNEIAGIEDTEHSRDADSRLHAVLEAMTAAAKASELVDAVSAAADERTWDKARDALIALAQAQLDHLAAAKAPPRQLAADGKAIASPPDAPVEHYQARVYCDILANILDSGLSRHLSENDELTQESRLLAGRLRAAQTETAVNAVAEDLRRFCRNLEVRAEDITELRDKLLRLLRLLVDNIGDLVVEDTWITRQLEVVREIVTRPAAARMVDEAEQYLREVLLKQGVIKQSIKEAKATLKSVATTFIDQLGVVSQDTGTYGRRIEEYAVRIRETEDIAELNRILDDLLDETRQMQNRTQQTHRELISAQERAHAAELKIRELEEDLMRVSQKLREDQLTGTLNRRGLNDAFVRESARSRRHDRPLCAALLDIDNFKKLNDTYGHGAGDQALIHLSRVIKDTVRPNDVVARYGGEEFLVLLPDTGVEEAVAAITRLQRELTKRIFLHHNEKILITFSAGVALWQPGESQDAVVARADAAQYQAKTAGKNRVIAATTLPPKSATTAPA